MADHGKLVLLWSPPMDVAVATAHWAKARTQISARDIQQRFAECGSSCLVANQRREDIALFQKQTARHAHRFLAFPNVDAAGDQAAPIETNEFFLQRSRQEHPAKRFGGDLVWRGQLHPYQLAHAALFHRYTVQHVGLGNGAFIVRDDDKLTLFYEAIQHTDKPVDVALIHGRIHFVENAERTWSHHVDCEQQCHRDHRALASAQQGNGLQLFPRGLGADFDSAVERIVFIEQGQVRASAAEELQEYFTKVDPYLSKGFAKQLPRSRVDLRNHVEQFATRISEVAILRFEKFVSLFQLVVFMNSIQVYGAHVVELRPKICDKLFDMWRSELR